MDSEGYDFVTYSGGTASAFNRTSLLRPNWAPDASIQLSVKHRLLREPAEICQGAGEMELARGGDRTASNRREVALTNVDRPSGEGWKSGK